MDNPRLSILLPVRDAESTLREALDSILRQRFGEFEVVVVDDHSTDGSMDIVTGFRDERILVCANPGDGLVDALNFGVTVARADWIVRMDADDIMHPDRLQRLWEFASHSTAAGLVASRVEMISDSPLTDGTIEYLRWQNSVLDPVQIGNQIYVESPFAHPSVMFHKSVIQLAGGYRQGDYPEDYELWLRLHRLGVSMTKLPEVLLQWRDSPGRLSRNHPAYRRESFDRLRAEHLAMDPRLGTDRPLAYWGAGRKTRRRSRLLIEKGFPPAAWIDIDPRKIGNRILGAEVVDPTWLAHRSPKPFVLVYVANHGAKEDIGGELERMGFNEGDDYLAVG